MKPRGREGKKMWETGTRKEERGRGQEGGEAGCDVLVR